MFSCTFHSEKVLIYWMSCRDPYICENIANRVNILLDPYGVTRDDDHVSCDRYLCTVQHIRLKSGIREH